MVTLYIFWDCPLVGQLPILWLPSLPQVLGIHLQSVQELSTVPQVEVSVQMLVALSKERNWQPVVEFWQLACLAHLGHRSEGFGDIAYGESHVSQGALSRHH